MAQVEGAASAIGAEVIWIGTRAAAGFQTAGTRAIVNAVRPRIGKLRLHIVAEAMHRVDLQRVVRRISVRLQCVDGSEVRAPARIAEPPRSRHWLGRPGSQNADTPFASFTRDGRILVALRLQMRTVRARHSRRSESCSTTVHAVRSDSIDTAQEPWWCCSPLFVHCSGAADSLCPQTGWGKRWSGLAAPGVTITEGNGGPVT